MFDDEMEAFKKALANDHQQQQHHHLRPSHEPEPPPAATAAATSHDRPTQMRVLSTTVAKPLSHTTPSSHTLQRQRLSLPQLQMRPQTLTRELPPPPPAAAPSAAAATTAATTASTAAASSSSASAASGVGRDPTLADWPADDFRLFVGNLGKEASDDNLTTAFSHYISFQKARVVKTREGKPAGYGFVSFKEPWDMARALREMAGKYVGNHPIKVRKADAKKSHDTVYNFARASNGKRRGAQHAAGGKRQHVHKRQKGMPW